MWKIKTESFNNFKSHSHELDPKNARIYFSYQKPDGKMEARITRNMPQIEKKLKKQK